MSTPAPAWVCAPGVRRLPNLAAFLPEYDLRALPGRDIQAVLGWGLKPTAAHGRRWAEQHGLPYVALEDGLLRSVGLGETGAASLSVVADDVGIYYDATRPSRLEQLIAGAPGWMSPDLRIRARALIDRIVESGVSKTNMGGPLDEAQLKPGRRILIVDQTHGDASIGFGMASNQSFIDMLDAARRDEPGAQLIVKRHPAVAAGRKQGCIPADRLGDATLIDTDVRPADLLAHVDAVYTVTSGLGWEALLRGLPVRCFGAPFYSGWGLTTDAVDTGRRGLLREIESIAAAALIRYARYVDPVTDRACDAEQALERLIALRDRAERLAGLNACVAFAPAKRPPVRRLLNSPKGPVRYFASASAARTAAEAEDGRIVCWASRTGPDFDQATEGFTGPVLRMEDGFIRSRGLGSDFVGALSITLDDLGVYYDATRPSRLEALIEQGGFPPALLARAARLRERIVEAGLSKYNLPAPPGAFDAWPKDRKRILIVGQVENDQSILKGCADIRTNAGLVAAVRADHPDAFLIYKTHPDVLAGNRPGLLDGAALDAVDASADGLDISQCVDHAHRLATLTSLSGFEALLRGKPVTTYGTPFFAGWGLTEDRVPCPRRRRRATLDELVAAALILYPVYVAPGGWPCEVEDLVEALIAARDKPAPPPPSNQIARWWTGIRASLDRTPPPSY
ncbi:MAG: capsular polysaccharide biosynthesis protein [Brevundimonas sp.]|uniref:capsular polysaccharide biosynthesis protein n=1 Tax=Brevundimonas sp. TaxID=1871086 RepID=UPI0039199D13